jgi:hypothetical protein
LQQHNYNNFASSALASFKSDDEHAKQLVRAAPYTVDRHYCGEQACSQQRFDQDFKIPMNLNTLRIGQKSALF